MQRTESIARSGASGRPEDGGGNAGRQQRGSPRIPRREESRKDVSEVMPSLRSRSVSQRAVLPGSPELDGALPDSPWLKGFTTPTLERLLWQGRGQK